MKEEEKGWVRPKSPSDRCNKTQTNIVKHPDIHPPSRTHGISRKTRPSQAASKRVKTRTACFSHHCKKNRNRVLGPSHFPSLQVLPACLPQRVQQLDFQFDQNPTAWVRVEQLVALYLFFIATHSPNVRKVCSIFPCHSCYYATKYRKMA